MTRPEASAALLALGASLPGLAGAHLVEASRAQYGGDSEALLFAAGVRSTDDDDSEDDEGGA